MKRGSGGSSMFGSKQVALVVVLLSWGFGTT